MSTVTRVENHIIKKSDPLYSWILEECLRSRNLYNRVLYIYRQAFTGKHENIEDYRDLIKDEKFVKKFDVRKRMAKINDVDYRTLLKNHSTAQVITQVDTIWNAWFKALKDFKKNPSKYTGRPKMPNYKKGDGVSNLLIYDDARIQKDGTINISKIIKSEFRSDSQMIQYKTEEIGCDCVELNESHTSKCSALDYESIGHHEEYVGKRTKRGLFRSSKNSYINADINGSLNILRRGLKTDFEINNNVIQTFTNRYRK